MEYTLETFQSEESTWLMLSPRSIVKDEVTFHNGRSTDVISSFLVSGPGHFVPRMYQLHFHKLWVLSMGGLWAKES